MPKDIKDTSLDLAHLERLLAEATPGRWSHRSKLEDGTPCCDVIGDSDDDWSIVATGNPDLFDMRDADASLIVAAVNALPALIAAARERDGWKRAAESQNRQWSQKCEALTEERARREELATQLLATQQDRHRILMERDKLEAVMLRLRLSLNDVTTECREAEAERDALRAEVERLRAALQGIVDHFDRDREKFVKSFVMYGPRAAMPLYNIAVAALDAAKEEGE